MYIEERRGFSYHKWSYTLISWNRHCSWRHSPVCLSTEYESARAGAICTMLRRAEPKRHITMRYVIHKIHKVREMITQCGNKNWNRHTDGQSNQSCQSKKKKNHQKGSITWEWKLMMKTGFVWTWLTTVFHLTLISLRCVTAVLFQNHCHGSYVINSDAASLEEFYICLITKLQIIWGPTTIYLIQCKLVR